MNISNYCEIHKNEIATSRCSKCARGICSRCSKNTSILCPTCRGTNILKVEKKHSQNEIRNILIAGFVMSILLTLINALMDNSEIIFNENLIINNILFLGLGFGFGISFASAIYFVRKTDVFDEIEDIPLIGIRIIKYIVIGTSLIGIPIIYFLYLVYKFFKKEE